MSPSEHSHRQIGRRAGIVGFFTLLSRILGLLRDAIVAFFFGASVKADAFYVAFRIPNLLRRLTAEGALTVAFIPIYTEQLKKSRDEGRRIASIVFTYLSVILVLIVLAGIILAPLIVRLIAFGFGDDPEKFQLTVLLTRIMFPYIFLISLTALAMGILNSLKRFAAPAASPIFLNVFIILGAVLLSRLFAEPTLGLAVGVLIGGLSQIGLQLPFLKKEGMLPRIDLDYRHPAVKGLILLMAPAAFGAAVYQVNVLIVTLMASFLPHGSVSYLWYADRLTEFPLGIFAIAIATATLPTLSDHAADKDLNSFKRTFRYSLTGTFLVMIPAAAGLFVLARPTVRLLFERGAFSAQDTAGTAGALCFFLLGLPFVSAVRNIVPAFFALKDSKTPVAVAALAVVVNAVCGPLLMKPLLHRGLALSIALASTANFFLLVLLLRRKIGPLGGREIGRSVARILAASAVMAASTWAFSRYILGGWLEAGPLKLALGVIVSVAVGMAVYLGALKLARAPEISMLTSLLRREKT